MDPVQVTKAVELAAAHEVHAPTDHDAHAVVATYPDHVDPSAYDALVRLVSEHREYDRQLKELRAKPWLSAADKLEEVRLKKLKLRQKDEIERLRHEMHMYMGQQLEH